jgi:hypothetical protein
MRTAVTAKSKQIPQLVHEGHFQRLHDLQAECATKVQRSPKQTFALGLLDLLDRLRRLPEPLCEFPPRESCDDEWLFWVSSCMSLFAKKCAVLVFV